MINYTDIDFWTEFNIERDVHTIAQFDPKVDVDVAGMVKPNTTIYEI